mmetsp:Transcript_30664/g.60706  ORF Transcript_30664/g.60706 Transcript_30664/m.60706 type:complete len:270 (-) Transcript_30664:96-905(-)
MNNFTGNIEPGIGSLFKHDSRVLERGGPRRRHTSGHLVITRIIFGPCVIIRVGMVVGGVVDCTPPVVHFVGRPHPLHCRRDESPHDIVRRGPRNGSPAPCTISCVVSCIVTIHVHDVAVAHDALGKRKHLRHRLRNARPSALQDAYLSAPAGSPYLPRPVHNREQVLVQVPLHPSLPDVQEVLQQRPNASGGEARHHVVVQHDGGHEALHGVCQIIVHNGGASERVRPQETRVQLPPPVAALIPGGALEVPLYQQANQRRHRPAHGVPH